VEREVLKPVEDAIKGISGVDKIYGTATDGYAQIIVIFVFEKEISQATQDIRDAISRSRGPSCGNEGADTAAVRSD
jgi:HAE1 family hydrophobic/amphiphilic exporter-1